MARRPERIAYHEAGHAVAFHLGNVRFKYVEICDPQNRPLAKTDPKILAKIGPMYCDGKGEAHIEGRVAVPNVGQRFSDTTAIVISLAGCAAEFIRYGNRTISIFSSMHEVLEIEDLLHGQTVYFWFDYTKDTMRIPCVWRAVEVLAGELLIDKKLSYRKAIEIIDKAIHPERR